MSKYEKKRKIYKATYETVDPLLPEIQQKVKLAFDILFEAVLKDSFQAILTQPSDSTPPSVSE